MRMRRQVDVKVIGLLYEKYLGVDERSSSKVTIFVWVPNEHVIEREKNGDERDWERGREKHGKVSIRNLALA